MRLNTEILVNMENTHLPGDLTRSVAPHGVGAAMMTLMACTFVVGTGEFAIMGMLPQFASSMSVTPASAGYAISAYALGVVLGAPAFAIVGSALPKRSLLLILISLFCIGNFMTVVMPSMGLVELARFITGLPHGALFGVSALVAASLVERARRGRAVGRVLSGIAMSTVIGAPFSTFAAIHLGWRTAYLLIGLAGCVIFAGFWRYLPSDPPRAGRSALSELTAFRRPQVLLTLLTCAVGFGGMFGAYTFLTAILTHVLHLPGWAVMAYMIVWGCGMLAGTHIGAFMVDRNLDLTAIGALVGTTFAMMAFAGLVNHPWGLLVDVFVLPAFMIALGPAMQTRLMDVAGDAQTLAASLNHSAFNTANAVGAALGSVLLEAGYGYSAIGWSGAVLSVAGLCVFLFTISLARREAASASSR